MSSVIRELSAQFAAAHPEEAARALETSTPQDVAALLETVGVETAADVIRRMHPPQAVACLSALEAARSAEICSRVPLDVAAILLRRMSPVTAESVLAHLKESRAVALRRLLRFTEGTAAAIADPQVLTLPSDISVGEAQKYLRRSAGFALYNLYVVDREQRLVGVLTYRTLFLAPPKAALNSVMQTGLISLPGQADLATIAVHPAWREFDALPVVDKAGVFLGIVRHKRIRQIFETGKDEGVPGLAMLATMAEWYWTSLATLMASLAQAAAARSSQTETGTRR